MKPPSIVIIEHESETRDLLMLAFESRGYLTWTCTALDAASAFFLTAQPDVLLIDIDDDSVSFANFLEAWKKDAPRTQVIVQTGRASEAQRVSVMNQGVHAYLLKPVSPEDLFEALNGRELEPLAAQ